MTNKLPTQTYHNIDIDELRNKLKLKAIEEKLKLVKKHPHVKKILAKKNLDLGNIRQHSAKLIGAGAIASALLLQPVAAKLLPISTAPTNIINVAKVNPQEVLLNDIKPILPDKIKPLTSEQEKKLEVIFKSVINIPAKATLEGEHLNTTYGRIGAEQHLRRYPGDTVNNHGTGTVLNEGMAPGLGAWGYFAPSKAKLSSNLVEDEKWYAVVQTLYLPDWEKRLPYLRDWYKYRKVLIVNTLNGNAVVAAVADSGPAMWTGKNFGGSPEVMESLGGPRYKAGPVILFFVDDPDNTIPLGPVEYNKIAANLAYE